MTHITLLSVLFSYLVCAYGLQITLTVYLNSQCSGGGLTEIYQNGACQNTTGLVSSYSYFCAGGQLSYSDYSNYGCVGTPNVTYSAINTCVQYPGFSTTLSKYITCAGNSISMNEIFKVIAVLQIVFLIVLI